MDPEPRYSMSQKAILTVLVAFLSGSACQKGGVSSGEDTLTFTPDGATLCDGCLPYTLSDGGGGQLCDRLLP